MKEALLTTGKISTHIRTIALPMSVGFFFNTMYNVVDSFYAGQISTAALAAMALSFPIFFLIIASSEGLSRGASVLIANALGSNNTQDAQIYTIQSVFLSTIAAMVIMAIGLVTTGPLLEILGASKESLALFWAERFTKEAIFRLLSGKIAGKT